MKFPAGFRYEKKLWKLGYKGVVGIDEVGRGAWAGPVIAAAVAFPPFFKPTFKLFDSKLLSSRQREILSKKIRRIANIGIGVVDELTIDKIGISKASQKAFRKAVMALKNTCDYYLIDAFYIQYWSRQNQRPVKDGDKICASIAAASIVAKVYRDNIMVGLSKNFPQYGFHLHKGYGTRLHQKKIHKHKLTNIHRKSFNLTPYLYV